MTLPFVVFAILCLLLFAAAISDLMSFTIPNILPGSMLVLFIGFVVAMSIGGSPLSGSLILQQFLTGGVGLAFGIALFATGWIGGGDAKLFAASCLWLSWNAMLDYAIVASLTGGAMAIVILAFRRLPLSTLLASKPRLKRLLSGEAGLPYGVALAIAGIATIPHVDVFGMTAGG